MLKMTVWRFALFLIIISGLVVFISIVVGSPDKKNVIFKEDAEFPPNFFFGTAYSDFQTAGLSPASDWAFEWEKIADIAQKDSIAKKGVNHKPIHPGIANDLFNRYREDFYFAHQIRN